MTIDTSAILNWTSSVAKEGQIGHDETARIGSHLRSGSTGIAIRGINSNNTKRLLAPLLSARKLQIRLSLNSVLQRISTQ